ncbi:IS66 family transposase [Viscerimonas tarda]
MQYNKWIFLLFPAYGKDIRNERQISEENLSREQIEELRKKRACPILKDFEKWMDMNYPHVLPKSLIGKAMSYTCG